MSLFSAIGNAIFGGSGAKDAARASQEATEQTIRFQQGIYDDSVARQQPFVDTGIAANNQLAALNGIYQPAGGSGGAGGASGGTADYGAYRAKFEGGIEAEFARLQTGKQANRFRDLDDYTQWHYENHGQSAGIELPTTGGVADSFANSDGTPTTATQAQDQAYDTFQNSGFARSALETTNDDFENIRGAYGAAGKLLSGSAVGALNDQNRANTSTAFSNYANSLTNQAGIGSGTAANIGSLGANLGSSVGNVLTNNAAVQGQAAITQANNNANLFGSIGSTVAGLFGGNSASTNGGTGVKNIFSKGGYF